MGRPRSKPLNPVLGRVLQAYGLAELPPSEQLAELARVLRVPEGTVRNWNKRESGVPRARLEAIAEERGRDIVWFAHGDDWPPPPLPMGHGEPNPRAGFGSPASQPRDMWSRVQSLHVSESPAPWREGERADTTQFGGQPIPTGGLAIPASALLRPRGAGAVRPLLLSVPLEGEGGRSRDYELIPKHLRPASAGRGGTSGNGAQEDVVDLVGEMAFSFEWMRQNLSHTTGQVTTIQVRGDSMATTLLDGDTIIIDEGAKHIDVDGIYVLDIAGRRMVKRVQHLFDGTLVLISDNPSYQRETIPRDRARDVKVIGRMVWPRVR